MNRALAIVIADVHAKAGDVIWAQRSEIHGDAQCGLAQVDALVSKYRPEWVFMLGDTFDLPLVPSDALELIGRYTANWRAAGAQVGYVCGQHELAEPPLVSVVCRDAVWLHGKRIECGGVSFFGLDYQRPARVELALAEVPSDAILLTHQVWKEMLGERHGYAALSMLPSGVQQVWSGDFHKHVMQQIGDKRFVSPGPLCAQAIDQVGPHGVVVVHNPQQLEFVPILSRRCHTVELATPEAVDSFIAEYAFEKLFPDCAMLPEAIAAPVLRVQYVGANGIRIHETVTTGTRRPHLFLERLPEETAGCSPTQVAVMPPTDFADAVQRATTDPWLQASAARLWESPEPAKDAAELLEALLREIDNETA